jgi:hypothetical protein
MIGAGGKVNAMPGASTKAVAIGEEAFGNNSSPGYSRSPYMPSMQVSPGIARGDLRYYRLAGNPPSINLLDTNHRV